MQKITPFLWYDTQAEEAANLYTSTFRDAKIKSISRYGEAGPGPKGSVMTVSFELNGQEFIALNAGPQFKFTPAVSFVINCESQEEVDHYWTRLSAGGRTDQCGWLTDKFGLSWQVVPTILSKLVGDKDPKKSQAVMQAMLQMTKMDIARLKEAYDQA